MDEATSSIISSSNMRAEAESESETDVGEGAGVVTESEADAGAGMGVEVEVEVGGSMIRTDFDSIPSSHEDDNTSEHREYIRES